MKTLIVIPTYNEKDNVPRLIPSVLQYAPDVEILIVDDNSPDGTGQMAESLRQKYKGLHVLHRRGKEGLGRAYIDGFRWALERDYEVIFQMDADLSHDPAALPRFLEQIREHDAVFGSRYLKGVRVYNWSFRRLLLSKLSNEWIRFFLRIDSTDTTTAYKCFRRRVLESMNWKRFHGRQNAFLIELVWSTIRKGFRTTEIPFVFMERESGESKMEMRVAFESLWTTFRLAFSRP